MPGRGVRAGRLAALAPIESELETETLVAWRQLVQVLTHEIMNSLTPVASPICWMAATPSVRSVNHSFNARKRRPSGMPQSR